VKIKMEAEYPDLHPFYKSVFNDTVKDELIAGELAFVRCFFEEWAGNFLHPLGNDLGGRRGKLNSILYSYMASQSHTFDWLSHTLMFGHYDTVFRELRTILENLFYMYSLDISFQTKTVGEKFQKLAQLEAIGKEPHGKVVFETSGYIHWQPSYNLYKQLSRYIHIHTNVSAKHALQIAEQGFPEILDIKYSRQSFTQCSSAWREIAKSALHLALDLCQKLNVEISELCPDHLEQVW
jgi:hypothetical protein